MVKRAGRFDPLPTSEDSDPALLSHRAIDSGATGTIVDSQKSDEAPSTNGLNNIVSGDNESHLERRHSKLDNGGDYLHDEDEEEEPMVCGLGRCFSPSWLQPLASKQMFLAVFCLACVLQGMFFTYFVSVLTTIEKLFQIQSKTTGIIMSATEMGQIGGALMFTYFAGQGHRPKWIGWGMVLFGCSAALCSLPHFLFWRIKPNTGFSTSVGSHGSSPLVDPPLLGLSSMESDLTAIPVPQRLEMDLICRQVENGTRWIKDDDEESELERNKQCAGMFDSELAQKWNVENSYSLAYVFT